MRVVPVPVRTAGVPVIIVERAAAHHAGVFQPVPATALHITQGGLPYQGFVTFNQPPSNLPISSSILAACMYCPLVIHSQRAASRK
jgi:hypothetical protein